MMVKRTVIEIVYEILQQDGRKKTDIMYRTALNYPQTQRYLRALTDRGLLEKRVDRSGRELFAATERGHELAGHLAAVVEYLGLDGGESV